MAKSCSLRNDVDADEAIVNGDKKLGMVARVFFVDMWNRTKCTEWSRNS